MVFQETILKKIVTTDTVIPSIPQVQLDNPLDKAIFVNGIELILQPEFARKGKVRILVNEVAVFTEADSEAFKGYSKFPIPLGKVLRQSNDIQIFAWNSEDSNTIELSVNLALSEELQPFNAQAETLQIDISNLAVSKAETLFADQTRAIGVFNQLLDMQGYKKIIVALGKTTPAPLGITPSIDIQFNIDPMTNLPPSVDGDFATQTDNGIINTPNTGRVKFDFGSIATRKLKAKHRCNVLGGGSGMNFVFDSSDDDIVYNTKFSKNYVAGTDTTETVDATDHSFRFCRLGYTETGNQTTVNIFEVFDANFSGGSGALSFDVRNSESGDFGELIPASEFGTITDGIEDVIKQVGDVTTISVSGKTYALPSTQTDFRAKYTITVGALKNAVTILKVQ